RARIAVEHGHELAVRGGRPCEIENKTIDELNHRRIALSRALRGRDRLCNGGEVPGDSRDSLGLRHELDVRLDDDSECSLRAHDEIREVERPSFRQHSLETIAARPAPERRRVPTDRCLVFRDETRHVAMQTRLESIAFAATPEFGDVDWTEARAAAV